MLDSIHHGNEVVIGSNVLAHTTCFAFFGAFICQSYLTCAPARLEEKLIADGVVVPGKCACIVETEWI